MLLTRYKELYYHICRVDVKPMYAQLYQIIYDLVIKAVSQCIYRKGLKRVVQVNINLACLSSEDLTLQLFLNIRVFLLSIGFWMHFPNCLKVNIERILLQLHASILTFYGLSIRKNNYTGL